MSTIYNWAYRPGTSNEYNINISAPADDMRHAKACYIVLFGNDLSGSVAMSSESYRHHEPGIRRATNNTGDSRSGSILCGNGDPAYVRRGVGVMNFPSTLNLSSYDISSGSIISNHKLKTI